MRTDITVTALTRAGVDPPALTDADMTNGMRIPTNNGHVFVEIISSDAAPQTVGFEIPKEIDGESVGDKTVTIPAGDTRLVGPFPPGDYNQDDGSVYVNPSLDGATLQFRAYKV